MCHCLAAGGVTDLAVRLSSRFRSGTIWPSLHDVPMRLEGLRVVEWLGPRGRRLRFGYPPGVTPTRFGPNARTRQWNECIDMTLARRGRRGRLAIVALVALPPWRDLDLEPLLADAAYGTKCRWRAGGRAAYFALRLSWLALLSPNRTLCL